MAKYFRFLGTSFRKYMNYQSKKTFARIQKDGLA